MSEPNSPVDPRDLELLRNEPPPDPGIRGRVRSRLSAVIPMGGAARSGMGGDSPPPSGARPPTAAAASGSLASFGTTAVAFVLGGAVGAALYAGLAKPPAARVVYVERPAATAAMSASRPPAQRDMSGAPGATSPAPSSALSQEVQTAAPSVPHASSAKSRASQLSAERLILEEARTAIMQGDAQRGLDRLERHRRLFPNPLLAEERDALQVQALVKAGRYDEARASADRFRNHTPDSLFLPMVEAAIASIP